MTEKEIRAEIGSKKLRNCYVFYGNEQYAMRRMVTAVSDFAVSKEDDFNRARFDGAVSVQEIFDAVYSLPFLSEKKLVTVVDLPLAKMSDKDIKVLVDIMSDLPPTTVLIIYFETVEIDTKRLPANLKKLTAACDKSGGAVCEFVRRTTPELTKMLIDGASRRGCRLQPSVAVYMIERCGDDLSVLVGELSKVCAYAHGENITKETVDKVCSKNIDVSIYDLSKKLLALDMQGVYILLDDLFFSRTPATYILSVLSSTFIDILRAKVIKESGKVPENFATDFGYSEKTAFKLKNAARDAAKLSMKGITECIEAFDECDANLKFSRMNEKTAIEHLVTNLAVIIERSR